MNSQANYVIESLKLKKELSKNVNECGFVTINFVSTKLKIHLQPMNVKGGVANLLMILRANEERESTLTIMKQIWTQMHGYFL